MEGDPQNVTPIVDKDDVEKALNRLRQVLRVEADNRRWHEHTAYGFRAQHFKPDETRDGVALSLLGDNRGTMRITVRHNEWGDPYTVSGLFFKDENETRLVTHDGRFSDGAFPFREKTKFLANVGGKDKSYHLVAFLDGEDEDLLKDVARFIKTRYGEVEDDPGEQSSDPKDDASNHQSTRSLNCVLYGPPGTGKTYLTARRCVKICDKLPTQSPTRQNENEIRNRYKQLVASGRVEFVTFHQSYGYEEFVEGLRPVPNEDGQAGFRLVPTPGVLKRIAERARGDLENAYVLVIDEINRANVSKVLGELITLLEEDKRQGEANEVAVTLPHSRKRFTLPSNLHILGTMNTADRSIALIDTALRRRFRFEEMAPDLEVLPRDCVEGINLRAVLKAINQRLEYLIDRDHLIGHAWLMKAETKAQVDDIMRHKIIPLIAEYFYDDWRKVQAVLGSTDHFVLREPLQRPPSLDDADVDDRSRWTVRDQFAPGAYSQLVVGQQTPREASEADDGA